MINDFTGVEARVPVLHCARLFLPRGEHGLFHQSPVHEFMQNDAVYLLWHTDADEDEKLIGVYRTEQDALVALERIKEKPGFTNEGGRFEVAEYELNQDHWTDGFVRPAD